MLKILVTSALKNRVWVFTLFIVVAALGIAAALHLPIDAVPDITNVQVVVNAKTGALDPSRVEKLVTYPIETEMQGVAGVEEVRSLSKYGLSQVVVIFNEGVDIYFARQLVAEKLQGVRESLPDGISAELAPVTTGLGEVLMYVLEPKLGSALSSQDEKSQLLYLREIQEYVVEPQLKKVPGVADIDTNGGLLKQVHINFFPDRLKEYGFSMEQLATKLESLGESFGGGYIQKGGMQVIVRATGKLESLDSIANIPLGPSFGGKLIRVKDVADVRFDNALRLGAATQSGKETVLGTVLMRTGANSREVSLKSEEALKSSISLPADVAVKIVYSRSYLVDATIRTVAKSLVEGAILVVLVLLFLIGNFRAAIIVALAIPISMLFALKGMSIFGISANLMSLGAIDFGLLVDGSVVLIENVIRRFEGLHGKEINKSEKIKLVLDASGEVLKPLVFGLLIIMLVYIPILYLEGVEGKMFRPMAATVLLALGASLLIALFLMPALAFMFIPIKQNEKEPILFRILRQSYQPLLNLSLRRKWLVFGLAVVPGLLALALFKQLGSDFVPQLDEGDLVINLSRSTKQGIDESVKWQKRSEEIIMKFTEVETVFSRMGTPESALDPMGPYLADTFVILKKDHSQWPIINGEIRTKEQLFEAMKEVLEKDNPDQEVSANQPIEMRFNEILEGSRADVALRIFGPDLDQLMEYAEQAEIALKDIPGISEMESDPLTALTKGPILDVNLNYDKISNLGLALKDVNQLLEHSMSGKDVGSFYQEDRRFPIILHLDESLRDDINAISSVPVALPQGGTIDLKQVASIEEHEQVTTIARSGARRYSALSIFLKDRDVGSFVKEAKDKIANSINLDPGYIFEWGGQFKNMEQARNRLLLIIPFTLLMIFILLIQSFGNIRHAALVFMAIPFAMAGGIFALYFRGINFSVSASVGFIALAGIATLNSMVMVNYFNQLKSEKLPLKDVVSLGALARLRPVSMTALVASLGFIPMAINTGTGAEVQRPLATVVIGGIITSTILTLLVVPVFYEWMERLKERFQKEAE